MLRTPLYIICIHHITITLPYSYYYMYTYTGRDTNHIPVAACHDEKTAHVAKSVGFTDIFYAKNKNTEGLTKTARL